MSTEQMCFSLDLHYPLKVHMWKASRVVYWEVVEPLRDPSEGTLAVTMSP